MKKLPSLICAIFLAATGAAHAAAPSILQESVSVEGFVPDGWNLEQAIKGDLNGDSKIDVALIIRKADPALIIKNENLGEEKFDSNPRSIIVAIQQSNGQYLRVAQNDHIIPVIDNGVMDDPINGVMVDETDALTIKNGVLRLHIGFWSSAGTWSMFHRTFSFRMDDGQVRLIGFDHVYVHRASGEFILCSLNYLTHRKKFQKGLISDDDIPEQWSRLDRKPQMMFGAIGDGFEFESDCD